LQLGKIGITRYKTTLGFRNRIIETKIKVLDRNFAIVGVYAPVEGKEQDTEKFYRKLQQSVHKIPKKKNIILAEDFNGNIGNRPIPKCIGTYGEEQVTNHNGATLRDLYAFNERKITNSFYRHKNLPGGGGGKRDRVNNRLRNYK
jgi:hypothetical protein